MLRTLGSLTLLLCIACSVVSAAEGRRATREDRGEQPRNGSKPVVDAGAARMVMIEVLIADMRHGEAAKGDASDPPGDPKARIQQLDKAGKLDSLTRVQLTTVEGQKASLKVGQRAARIVGSQRIGGGGFGGGGGGGQVNSITFENVGLMLGVTPQIRRDGLVVMSIDIERSQLGPAEEGPVISKPADSEAIRAAPTETLTAQTTISARSGQSVIVGLQQTKQQARQSELLIIVTPELLGNEPPPAAR
jgi:Flp pilus assembly secretin CpaC